MPTHAEDRDVPLVDLRGLDPPEPLTRILDALAAEGPLRFLLSREPLPLYPILRLEGRRFRVSTQSEGVELTLERRAAR
jgi:hypothetical protein